MLYLDGIVGLALLALWIFCIVDVIGTPDGATRNLPKMLWLLLVILLGDIGSVLWLVAGRPKATASASGGFYQGAQSKGFPEYERLGRATTEDPEADANFLRQCRERAQQQRQRQRHQQGTDSES